MGWNSLGDAMQPVTTLITAPEDNPVTLSDAMDQLRAYESDETRVEYLINTATDYVQRYTGRRLMQQTYDAAYRRFSDCMKIPFPPLISVTSVKYIDTNGTLQTLSPSIYEVDTASSPGVVRLAYNQSWPTPRDTWNAVTIRFVAGYGTVDDVPERFKQAILLEIERQFDRGDPAYIQTLQDRIDSLLDSDRVRY